VRRLEDAVDAVAWKAEDRVDTPNDEALDEHICGRARDMILGSYSEPRSGAMSDGRL
jgi:hypothetical protein